MAKSTPKKSSKTRANNSTRGKSASPKANAGNKGSSAQNKRAAAAKPGTNHAKMNASAVARPTPETANLSTRQPRRIAKNQAGLKPKDLQLFRELLLAKRRELLGDVTSMEEEALRAGGGSNLSNLPIHMADMGTDNYEQEFTLNLVQKARELLHEINSALRKIEDGTYGICEGTGKPISRARLEARPWTKYSIEYARQMEKGVAPRA